MKPNKEVFGAPLNDTQARFAETSWTVVLLAADRSAPGGQDALEALCRAYWYPLYSFLRRSGRNRQDSQDLVQGFLSHLLAKESRLKSAHPVKGKFRTFLLACLRNYVANRDDWDKSRSPQGSIISIDSDMAEERYYTEPAHLEDPATIFERRWAFAVVEQTMAHLRDACATEGKLATFEALSNYLRGDASRGEYSQIATRLGMNEGAVRTEASRLRLRYRNLLLQEIARTIENPAGLADEVRALFALFSR